MAVELRRGGLHLTGTALALDATRKSELSFVSHAHSDHIARHQRSIATAATLKLMAHRLGELPAALPVPYNRPFELGALSVELLPAGHILGSAQVRVTRADGVRVVYTGDLNPEPSSAAEPAQVAECDVLVIESTFGHPRYAFPPRAQVLSDIEAWTRARLAEGVTPILLGYPLGKSQEAIKHLGDRGFELCAPASTHELCGLYGELGMPLKVRRFDGRFKEGEVGVFPPFARSSALRKVTPRATAVLTGWALDSYAVRRYGADAAFPLSDHADFPSLMRYVKATGATEVLTCHGFVDEFAKALREQGIDAHPVGKPRQLELLPLASIATARARTG
ncbi:MAG: MBL fold metallo-hydrolase [Myxococcaceae bacterium]